MGKIWFFGDSFCTNNDNWVAQVAKNLDCEIASLGVAGTSIDFLAETLIANRNLILEEDYVIVCITGYTRHYFRGENFRISTAIDPHDDYVTFDSSTGLFVPIDQNKILAYEMFIKHLYTDEIHKKNSFIISNHIINEIIPSLPTKKVVYFFSMADEIKTFEFFKQNQSVICKPLYRVFKEFVESTEDYKKLTEEDQQVLKAKLLLTNNHFIEDPEYYKMFWKEINPVLELIGAQIKID